MSERTIVAILIFWLISCCSAEYGWSQDILVNDKSGDTVGYHILGDAYWDEDNGYFVLTKSEPQQKGRIFLSSPFEMRSFLAEFEFRIWEGVGMVGGADGMTFAFVRRYDYPGGSGGTLDFFGAEGYAVEFDTYPGEHHIGLLKNNVDNQLETVVIPGGFGDDGWHHIRIVFTNGQITVYYDGKEVISSYPIPNYTAFTGYFGFTAATGNDYEWHAVRNIRITPTLDVKSDYDITVEVYTVQKGDTLEKIARDKLGDPKLWVQLAKYNGISTPHLIKVGEKILVPSEAQLILKVRERENLEMRVEELENQLAKLQVLINELLKRAKQSE